MKRIAVLIRDRDRQAEGLKIGMGLSGRDRRVEIFIMEHALNPDSGSLKETGPFPGEAAAFYSDNPVNVERYGFQYATRDEMAERVKEADVVIPY